MRKKWTPEDRPLVGTRAALPQGVVKSAGRVLRILEYFDEIQRVANIVEISQMLKLPQSSTSALLRSMVAMGYLHFDRAARTYWPSCRVALLGNWINSPLFMGGVVLRCMDELQQRTGDAVMLAMQHDVWSQYIHVLQATSLARLHVTRGALRPLGASGTGFALLSAMPDAEIRQTVHRINAEARGGKGTGVAPEQLMSTVEEVRRSGYAFTIDLVTPGAGILAMVLPVADGRNPLVVGIGGISEVLKKRKTELIKVMRDTLANHFPK